MPADLESVHDVLARVESYADRPPGTDTYCESRDALFDAERLAREILKLSVEREHYRIALERIEIEDHEGGPGWFAEIAADALHRYRM